MATTLAFVSTIAVGQQVAPVPALTVQPATETLPPNTPVLLTIDDSMSTRDKRLKKDTSFTLRVADDVVHNGYIVIPRGSRATGHIVKLSRKGGFGKSGKIEIAADYVDVGATRIPIEGHLREQGAGNSGATVATAMFATIIGAGLITGHSGEIAPGRQVAAWTTAAVPLDLAALEPSRPAAAIAQRTKPAPAAVVAQPVVAVSEFGNAHVTCVTCRR
ncbi:MAG: hypothetical protein ABIT09_06635 [Croceibacterium sp.]